MKKVNAQQAIDIIKKNNPEVMLFEATPADKQKLIELVKNMNQSIVILRGQQWNV